MLLSCYCSYGADNYRDFSTVGRNMRAVLNPALLKWARETAGLSIEAAAAKAGVTPMQLSRWESEEAQPTVRQARLLAKAYHKPVPFFMLSEPPASRTGLSDFRRPSPRTADKSPALLTAISRALFRREVALDLASEPGEAFPSFSLSASADSNPYDVGARIREHLGIGDSEQLGWRDEYSALRGWIRAAEDHGVLVFQFSSVDTDEARGFSIYDPLLPTISLNAKDVPQARSFTLLHELCHIAMQQAGICDLHENGGADRIEVFCNAAAGEALVPRHLLLAQPEVENNWGEEEWDDRIILRLSHRFKVSREVVLRRLLILGRTSQEFYQRKRNEQASKVLRTGGGYIEIPKKVVRDNGIAFTALVLDAYHRNAITGIAVSRYLGSVRLVHLDAIEHEVAYHWA